MPCLYGHNFYGRCRLGIHRRATALAVKTLAQRKATDNNASASINPGESEFRTSDEKEHQA